MSEDKKRITIADLPESAVAELAAEGAQQAADVKGGLRIGARLGLRAGIRAGIRQYDGIRKLNTTTNSWTFK